MLGTAALAASAAAGEPEGKKGGLGRGEDGGIDRSSLDEAFAFPSQQSSMGFCVFMVC